MGYRFGDPALLAEALTHRSWANENPSLGGDNERLEFLGDAVLGLSIQKARLAADARGLVSANGIEDRIEAGRLLTNLATTINVYTQDSRHRRHRGQ